MYLFSLLPLEFFFFSSLTFFPSLGGPSKIVVTVMINLQMMFGVSQEIG